RQPLLVIDQGQVRSRLISPREGARLMGRPDRYALPGSQTAGLHVIGDGVAVPVVRWLAERLLDPLVDSKSASLAAE
ncbi:MAG: DNA cytosine methyltransferase, partial [bacterium]|nr:DNA cytosine methyltransferase [bacterium]